METTIIIEQPRYLQAVDFHYNILGIFSVIEQSTFYSHFCPSV